MLTICIKRDTEENFCIENLVLRPQEIAGSYENGKVIGYKIGDGHTPWKDLPYIDNITEVSEFLLYTPGTSEPTVRVILDPITINRFLEERK